MTPDERARLLALVEEWQECENEVALLPAARVTYRICRTRLAALLQPVGKEPLK